MITSGFLFAVLFFIVLALGIVLLKSFGVILKLLLVGVLAYSVTWFLINVTGVRRPDITAVFYSVCNSVVDFENFIDAWQSFKNENESMDQASFQTQYEDSELIQVESEDYQRQIAIEMYEKYLKGKDLVGKINHYQFQGEGSTNDR